MKESTNKTTGSQSKTTKTTAKTVNASRGVAGTRGTVRNQSSGTCRNGSHNNNPEGHNQYTKK